MWLEPDPVSTLLDTHSLWQHFLAAKAFNDLPRRSSNSGNQRFLFFSFDPAWRRCWWSSDEFIACCLFTYFSDDPLENSCHRCSAIICTSARASALLGIRGTCRICKSH